MAEFNLTEVLDRLKDRDSFLTQEEWELLTCHGKELANQGNSVDYVGPREGITMTQVSELSGALLDFWVACALDAEAQLFNYGSDEAWCGIASEEYGFCGFEPSSCWEDGMPIVEREGITIQRLDNVKRPHHWMAKLSADTEIPLVFIGNTLLEAAMRLYVATKFGHEVMTLGEKDEHPTN